MVDPGEKISATLKREFGEEALNSLQKTSAEKREIEEKLHKLFSQDHLLVRNSVSGRDLVLWIVKSDLKVDLEICMSISK